MENLENKKVLLFGLGLLGGGVAVVRWLKQQGAKVTVVDSKSQKELAPSLAKLKQYNIKYFFNTQPDKNFLNFDLVVKNPAVWRDHPFLGLAKKAGIPIYNEASLFFSLVDNPIIGITGSKGKSTTTDLTGKIFTKWKQNTLFGGNIQIVPMFKILNKIKADSPVILELSSWHLEGLPMIKKSPHLAVITNILPDHLNRYKNFKDYAATKDLILKYQKKDDFAVLNYDNFYCRRMGSKTKAKVYWFGIKKYKNSKNLPGVFIKGNWIVFKKVKIEKIMNLNSVKLKGTHNLSNILAAVCVAKIKGVPDSIIRKVISSYEGLASRLEFVRKVKGISFYNDTTATAPVATVAALQSFSKPVILLAGGSDKKLPIKDMAKAIKSKTKYCLLFTGAGSNRLIKELTRIKYPKTRLITGIDSMIDMIKKTSQLARSGDIVLLSPGFASFSNFTNEFDRGKQFVKVIEKYDKKKL